MNWLDAGTLAFLLLAAAVLGAAAEMLWWFVRSSNRDPLTPQAPDARSAWARRWAGVYVRRPEEKSGQR